MSVLIGLLDYFDKYSVLTAINIPSGVFVTFGGIRHILRPALLVSVALVCLWGV